MSRSRDYAATLAFQHGTALTNYPRCSIAHERIVAAIERAVREALAKAAVEASRAEHGSRDEIIAAIRALGAAK